MTRSRKSRLPRGRTVVAITGGARGIGRATAEALRAAGATVVIGDIDGELARKPPPSWGSRGLPVDVADQGSFEAFFAAAEDELGPVEADGLRKYTRRTAITTPSAGAL